MSDQLRIYDLPESRGQLHLHTDRSGNIVERGTVYDYSRKVSIPLNGYEASMAELNAQQLEFKQINKY